MTSPWPHRQNDGNDVPWFFWSTPATQGAGIFMLAVLPQFVNPQAPLLIQYLILGAP